MKKYLIILICQFLMSNNIMKYEISLYNIPMAEVTINYQNIFFENKEAINLSFKTHTNKFTSRVHELWDEKKSFESIYNAIEKQKHRKVQLIKFPYWYLRIAAKQIMLRNIKLSTLVRTVSQFDIIFSIIKNSNLLIKFLIIFESIINIFWYGLISTLKFKKLHEKK